MELEADSKRSYRQDNTEPVADGKGPIHDIEECFKTIKYHLNLDKR